MKKKIPAHQKCSTPPPPPTSSRIKWLAPYLHFSVRHVVSRLFAPSFSLANSLISADVLSAARKRYKNTLY